MIVLILTAAEKWDIFHLLLPPLTSLHSDQPFLTWKISHFSLVFIWFINLVPLLSPENLNIVCSPAHQRFYHTKLETFEPSGPAENVCRRFMSNSTNSWEELHTFELTSPAKTHKVSFSRERLPFTAWISLFDQRCSQDFEVVSRRSWQT